MLIRVVVVELLLGLFCCFLLERFRLWVMCFVFVFGSGYSFGYLVWGWACHLDYVLVMLVGGLLFVVV